MDLLVDADILACQYAYVYEVSRGWDAGDDFDIDDAGWAISGFDSAVVRMMSETGTENAILCFTGRDNFRYSILPTYKSNRRGASPGRCFWMCLLNMRGIYGTASQ